MPVRKYSLTVRIVWAKYSFLNVTVHNTHKPPLGFNPGVSKLLGGGGPTTKTVSLACFAGHTCKKSQAEYPPVYIIV